MTRHLTSEDMFVMPINLLNAPHNMLGVPLADCPNCKYRGAYEGQYCYMLDNHPGERCGQFRPGN